MKRAGLALFGCGLLAACGEQAAEQRVMTGDAEAGRRAIARLECGVCHVVPGVRGARGSVGPSLAGFAQRSYIGGTVPNTPSALVRWIQAAPELIPTTAMPNLPVESGEARNIAAYLYTLR